MHVDAAEYYYLTSQTNYFKDIEPYPPHRNLVSFSELLLVIMESIIFFTDAPLVHYAALISFWLRSKYHILFA